MIVLSSCSLWLVVYPIGLWAPGVLTSMGIHSPYAHIPLISLINVWLNGYAMLPLLTSIVGHWLSLPRPSVVEKQPWRTLDQGFKWRSTKALIVLAYFVPTVTVWLLNELHSPLGPGGATNDTAL